jgi:hypothetical protein
MLKLFGNLTMDTSMPNILELSKVITILADYKDEEKSE